MKSEQRNAMRESARRLLERVHSDRNREIVRKYKSINALGVEPPPVAVHVPDNAQREYFGTDPLESRIRRFDLLGADMPVSSIIYTGLCAEITDFSPEYRTVRAKADGTSSAFEPCIHEYSDLKKLRVPEVRVDWHKTNEQWEETADAVGDILDVRPGIPFFMTCGWGESMIDQLVEMRGLSQLYDDLIEAPEFVHEAMDFMTNAKLQMLESYREQNALICNWQGDFTIGCCSYPLTDELPEADGRSESALWGYAQAQEFTSVSKEMLAEFVLPYQARIANRYGLLSYGCCEPMDRQIDLLADTFPKLRILSVSPFSNIDVAAEKSRGRFVMNCKIHPSITANFDEQRAREYLKNLVLKLHGCSATISFAEIMAYGNDLSIFPKLAEIAKDAVDRYWSPE